MFIEKKKKEDFIDKKRIKSISLFIFQNTIKPKWLIKTTRYFAILLSDI